MKLIVGMVDEFLFCEFYVLLKLHIAPCFQESVLWEWRKEINRPIKSVYYLNTPKSKIHKVSDEEYKSKPGMEGLPKINVVLRGCIASSTIEGIYSDLF